MAARLPVFNKALRLEEAHQFTRPHLGHAAQSGTATVSSSTCTSRSSWGSGWAWASMETRCCSIASRIPNPLCRKSEIPRSVLSKINLSCHSRESGNPSWTSPFAGATTVILTPLGGPQAREHSERQLERVFTQTLKPGPFPAVAGSPGYPGAAWDLGVNEQPTRFFPCGS
jgi:hypothetical protein